jgi:hypothetical protein
VAVSEPLQGRYCRVASQIKFVRNGPSGYSKIKSISSPTRLPYPSVCEKTTAEYVYAMRNIAFAHVVIADHEHRFVLRFGSLGIWRSPLVNFQELMVEKPFGLDDVRSGLTHQLPVHRPMANHVIKQWVGKYRLGAIDWLLNRIARLEEQTTCVPDSRITCRVAFHSSDLSRQPSSFLCF